MFLGWGGLGLEGDEIIEIELTNFDLKSKHKLKLLNVRNSLMLLVFCLSISELKAQELISKLSDATCLCIKTIDKEQDITEQLKSCVTKAFELYKFALVEEYGEDFLNVEEVQTNLVADLLKNCDGFVDLIQSSNNSKNKKELNSGSSQGIYSGFDDIKNDNLKITGFNGGESFYKILKPWDNWEEIKETHNDGKIVRVDWTEDYFFDSDSVKFLLTKSVDFIDFTPYPNDQSSITFRGHKKSILTIDVSNDGKRIYSGSNDSTIKIWKADSSAEAVATLSGHNAGIWSIDLSEDNSLLVSSGSTDKKILIWDVKSKVIRKELLGHKYVINTVSFSKKNDLLISGGGDHNDLTTELILWGMENESMTILEGHTVPVYAAQFDPKTKYIVSGDKDGKLIVWDVKKRTLLKSIQGHEESILSLDISGNGKYIATCGRDETVKIWSLPELKNVKTLEGHTYIVREVAFNKKGDKVVSASNDRKLIVWNFDTGNKEVMLEGHASTIFGVKFSNDGKKLISGSWDTTVKVWDLVEN